MAAARKSKAVELFWRAHLRLYRWTGGRVGGRLQGMPVLLLTAVGRKSGDRRTTPLTYLAEGDAYVVIASYLGEPRHPAWFLNLQAQPDVEVQVRGERRRVHAREAAGAERERLWSAAVATNPDYAEYQTRTERRIPIVVLDPR